VSDRLVVTVDVECDSDGGPTWRYSDPLTFRGVEHGLGEVLAPMLPETGGVATLLVSNVVMTHAPSVALLRELPSVELGAHLHGDFLRPDPRVAGPAGARTIENQNEYPAEVERAKLKVLGEMFRSNFGADPVSFRAGRWSAAGRTVSLLAELGYRVDSSVSPAVHWQDGGRSVDYSNAPVQPYRPSSDDIATPGDVPLWELPVSIVRSWLSPFRPVWLRPSRSSPAAMRRVVAKIRSRFEGPRTFVMMFHNNELTPGASPYSRDDDAALRVRRNLMEFLAWARDDGMVFMTMAQAAEALDARD
jgi:hypothetical protein